MQKKILIIDDDQKLNGLLTDYLTKYSFEVSSVTHPDDGLKRLKNHQPDMIILDVMLPGMDGFEVCRQIRKEYTVPIIMLTARGEVTDRIVGLELGADDYLPKPFEPRELVARIQTVLRRNSDQVIVDVLYFGDLRIDTRKQMVFLSEELLDLTTAEYEILLVLARNSGKVMNRDQIMESLRGYEWDSFNRSIDISLSRLRNKLKDDPKNPKWIKTVWGTGYLFMAEQTS